MQQVAPDMPIAEDQMFNLIVQDLTQPPIQAAQVEMQLRHCQYLFKSLRNEATLRLTFQAIELLLVALALGLLPQPCFHTNLRDMFILAVIVDTLQAVRSLQLIYLTSSDLKELEVYGQISRLPYPDYSYQNKKFLLDSISDCNFCFKFNKYMLIILEVSVFVQAQISIYSNLSGQCKIGESDNDFTWGIAFTFLIVRYITVGIPLLVLVGYILATPILCCINIHHMQKMNRIGATQDNIKKLKSEVVGSGRISEDNECVICLQNFVESEEFVRLKCHPEHVYHKICIVDWIKARAECPKCRSPVKFE